MSWESWVNTDLHVVVRLVHLWENRHQLSHKDHRWSCFVRAEVNLHLSFWFAHLARWFFHVWSLPRRQSDQLSFEFLLLTLCPSRWGNDTSKPFNASCKVTVKLVYRSLFFRSNRECLIENEQCEWKGIESLITFEYEWQISNHLVHLPYVVLLDKRSMNKWWKGNINKPSARNGIWYPSATPASTSTSKTFSSVTNLSKTFFW